jgi:peptidoglycan/xylan/chitin deacetylase (PgdA/CDA1 family)
MILLMRNALVRAATYAAAVPLVRAAAAAGAHIRGRSLVLLYHRVRPHGRAAHDVVPTVAIDTLRCHIKALRRFADVVSLDDLVSGADPDRLRVAITFDDDDLMTVEHALPVLEASDVRATFFLSGRALNGLDDYWWVRLEHLLATAGIAAVRTALKVGGDVADIARACENSEVVRRLPAITGMPPRPQLGATEIARLSQAGMTIGFHTLEHLVLTALGPAALTDALARGRNRARAGVATGCSLHRVPTWAGRHTRCLRCGCKRLSRRFRDRRTSGVARCQSMADSPLGARIAAGGAAHRRGALAVARPRASRGRVIGRETYGAGRLAPVVPVIDYRMNVPVVSC